MIQLLDEIGESGFQSAAFLTYGTDLGFFETKVMNRLLEMGCRNVVVLADGHQVKDALNSAAQLRYVGVQCPIVPIRLGNRAFHPKAMLMVGEEKLKLLIGSGNLTIPGYTRNWEIFTKLEGKEAAGVALELLDVFRDAASWSPLESAFDAWKKRLETSTPWLFGEENSDQSVRLLSSAHAPILPGVMDSLDGLEVDEILVASPFFDADASALRWLVDNFSPQRLTLLIENGAQLDPACVGEVLTTMGVESSVRRFLGNGRPLHGKLFLFKGAWGEALLAGSPNASSAALLSRAGRGRGNFELATFQFGITDELSALIEDRIGEPVSLQQISFQRPNLIVPKVSPLELEAVWVSEGTLFALPAEKAVRDRAAVDLVVDRGNHEGSKLRLHRQDDSFFSVMLSDEERLHLEKGPARAYLLGPEEESGAPVWVQNLDAVEKRSNPVQRPRYPKGLRALESDSLGPEWESWKSLFEAFSAFSNSWRRYADARPRVSKSVKPKESSQQAWDPEFFYISRDEVTLELPRYFAKLENSDVAIGDFEYLIGALPTARRSPSDSATYSEESTDALVDEELPDGEGEDTKVENTESRAEVTEEHREWLRARLYKKFRSIIGDYEDSIAKAVVHNKAEASYLCLPYPALQKAIMISAREGFLDVWQFRELASRLTAAWTMGLWKDLHDKEELEDRLACAATSLAMVAIVTSPWLRQLASVDEFDYDLYKQLRESLRELQTVFLSVKKAYDAGENTPQWERLAEEYNRLRHVELKEEYFASWTSLQVLDDLTSRYKVWRLDETPLWQKTAEELGVGGAVQRSGDVLRLRAKLPHIGNQQRSLGRLLYSIHEEIRSSAAVLWDNEDPEGKIRRKAMILCPDLDAVLEISLFQAKRPLLRRHRVTGGGAGSGVHLTNSQYQSFVWRGNWIHPMDTDQKPLFRCATDLLPELPISASVYSKHPSQRQRR